MLKIKLLGKMIGRKGQSIVEISLITPLLLVALYIPADFGIAMFTAHLTQNAVREAARIAVSTKDPFNNAAATAIANEALSRIPNRLDGATVTVDYYASTIDPCMQSVAVTATGDYSYFFYRLMKLFGASVPPSVQLTRTSRMRYEFQPVTNATPMCTSPLVTATQPS
jgi:Flp pilus assembly protein TadG